MLYYLYFQYFLIYGSYLIFLFLILFIYQLKINKKRGQRLFYTILIAISLIFVYARFIEPNWLNIQNYHYILNNDSIKQEKTIKTVVISDLHLGIYKNHDYLSKIVKKINNLNPDLVLIPGDFVFHLNKEKIQKYFQPLTKLNAPTFGVTGNHDDGNPGKDISADLTIELGKLGINIINDETATITIKDNTIKIIGFRDYWNDKKNYNVAKIVQKEDLLLGLVHNPDAVYNFPINNIDIFVTGHTHGGQIRIPYLYELAIPCIYPFGKGFYLTNNQMVFVSPGVGMVGLPMRFLMRPEISVVEITI